MTGVVVLIMALVGGSWAVLAGDFIQVLILMPVCLAASAIMFVLRADRGAAIPLGAVCVPLRRIVRSRRGVRRGSAHAHAGSGR